MVKKNSSAAAINSVGQQVVRVTTDEFVRDILTHDLDIPILITGTYGVGKSHIAKILSSTSLPLYDLENITYDTTLQQFGDRQLHLVNLRQLSSVIQEGRHKVFIGMADNISAVHEMLECAHIYVMHAPNDFLRMVLTARLDSHLSLRTGRDEFGLDEYVNTQAAIPYIMNSWPMTYIEITDIPSDPEGLASKNGLTPRISPI